jgi:HK97 family phage prohead protease
MRPERRYTNGIAVERRSVNGVEVPILRGHAAVFGEWTTLYESRSWVWREVVRPGAFAAAIAERQDVRGLFNHDPNFVLGRTSSNTLQIREDARGLLSEYEVLDSQTIRDLVITPVQRQDITGQSFAFLPRNDGTEVITRKEDGSVVYETPGERVTYRKDERDRIVEERELLSVDLFDVSVVTYPAYTGSDVSARNATLVMRGMVPDFEPEARLKEARSRFDVHTLPDAERDRRRRRSQVLMDLDLKLAEAGSRA